MEWRKGKRVAIVGGGPGGISSALAFLKKGFDVQVFERQAEPKALGGAVLLSVPVLAVLQNYGISLDNFGSHTTVAFKNHKGKMRADLPFNPIVEQAFNIKGWHYGVLRSSAFAKMLERVPTGIIHPNHSFSHYEETADTVVVHFDSAESVEADILIGADGINSKVSTQAFGDLGLFHIGLRIWLAWCDPIDDIEPNTGVISHSHKYQASYFPMLHDGKPGYEWWIVEPQKEHAPKPLDVKKHVQHILNDFADPLPRFPDATDFDTQIFCWDVYNRPSLSSWSKGRVVCVGDAVHPVSPYAAYGMGMAIEDGYFLAKFLEGKDLSSLSQLTQGFASYEQERVKYVNHNVEFARKMGNIFHQQPYPIAKFRDFIFDNTPLLNKMIQKDYLGEQEAMCMSMNDLHVKRAGRGQ
jgi:2-polyprenyl-6-methoxyphenol hydroxylase-like FAD-dependent oxidoreductase